MNYFISDLHFGHKNIIKLDERPFSSVEEMDSELIRRWNNVVAERDTVYILGDFSWYKSEQTTEILKQLTGRKRLIRGNHDGFLHSAECKRQFESIKDYDEIKVDGRKIVLSHYPIHFFNGHYHDSIMLYGHVHTTHEFTLTKQIQQDLINNNLPCSMYNVGCMMDYMDYTPRTLEEIIKGIK